jgi:hypothetical protein
LFTKNIENKIAITVVLTFILLQWTFFSDIGLRLPYVNNYFYKLNVWALAIAMLIIVLCHILIKLNKAKQIIAYCTLLFILFIAFDSYTILQKTATGQSLFFNIPYQPVAIVNN